MIRDMRNSPALLAGTLNLIDAMLQSRAGPAYEGQLALMTIWAESVKMAEAREEGAAEMTEEAVRRIPHQWDMLSGHSTRTRIMQLIREDIQKIKRERQEDME